MGHNSYNQAFNCTTKQEPEALDTKFVKLV